jgi:hypothetical protein
MPPVLHTHSQRHRLPFCPSTRCSSACRERYRGSGLGRWRAGSVAQTHSITTTARTVTSTTATAPTAPITPTAPRRLDANDNT